MSAIVIGDNCDDSITSSTADSHDGQKSPETIVRSTCHPEKHACRKWKWHRCRGGESTGSPFVKKAENGIQLPISELAVQVGRSGPSCDSEREKAPITDPTVATAAYSYHGLRWLAARIAVRMSGPPNVGRGELSRIARKKSPSAPKWRNIEVTPCPRFRLAFWMKAFNMGAIYQLCWTILRTAFSAPGATPFPRGVKR